MVNLLCLFFHISIALSISDFYYIITETNSNTTLTRLHISLVHIFPLKIYLENAKKNSCLPLPIVSISSKFGTSAKYKEDFEIPCYCCSICFHLLKFYNTDIYVTEVMINIWHEHTETGMKKLFTWGDPYMIQGFTEYLDLPWTGSASTVLVVVGAGKSTGCMDMSSLSGLILLKKMLSYLYGATLIAEQNVTATSILFCWLVS